MFWFKRKKIYVDCFIDSETINKYYPIKRAMHYVPSWWTNLDKTYTITNMDTGLNIRTATMKTCAGFIDLYKQGFIIPMWADLQFDVNLDGYAYQFAMVETKVQRHQENQHGDSFKRMLHAKINCPWRIKEKTGVTFLYNGCTWTLARLFPNIITLPGVINFKYQIATNMNMFIKLLEHPYRMEIEAGTAMYHLVPITDKEVIMKTHVLNEQEYKLLGTDGLTNKFFNGYKNKIHPKIIS